MGLYSSHRYHMFRIEEFKHHNGAAGCSDERGKYSEPEGVGHGEGDGDWIWFRQCALRILFVSNRKRHTGNGDEQG